MSLPFTRSSRSSTVHFHTIKSKLRYVVEPKPLVEKLLHKIEPILPEVLKPHHDSVDWLAVRKDLAEVMASSPDYDGIGSYAPILIRLAWHSSGSYDKVSGTGGSNGAGMRFAPESGYGANAGLAVARNLLEPIKAKYGNALSYSDLWTLAGVVAVEEMGGPLVEWHSGRADVTADATLPPDGRLPDATQGAKHLRDVFYRMGLNDQEIVALSGAHAVGKCHTDRSGFDGPWTFSPVTFSNAYFKHLLSEQWVEKKTLTREKVVTDKHNISKTVTEQVPWTGPKQFVDAKTQSIMMLPTDMELVHDKEFRHWTDKYAADE